MAFLRKNKVVLFIVIFVIISLIAPEVAHAKNGTLESVHSEAVINNDGTVDIVQTWIFDDTHIKKGTEHYINMNVAYEKGSPLKNPLVSTCILLFEILSLYPPPCKIHFLALSQLS